MNTMYKSINAEVITKCASIIAMKSLKTVYAKKGIELFAPSTYNPIHEDLVSIALVAIFENIPIDATIEEIDTLFTEEYEDVVKSAYKAINAYIYSMNKDSKMRLYSLDEDGVTIHNVTTEIEKAQFELMDILKRNLRESEYKVVKMVTKGYTNETIKKRMGYKSMSSTMRKVQTSLKSAREIAKAHGYDMK